MPQRLSKLSEGVAITNSAPTVSWDRSLAVDDSDIEFLHNQLLESEVPLTTAEVALVLLRRSAEREAAQRERRRAVGEATVYRPKDDYTLGQHLTFPILGDAVGQVVAIRSGRNPEHGAFSVLEVDFGAEASRRHFAAGLPLHRLNEIESAEALPPQSPEELLRVHGHEVLPIIEARLNARGDMASAFGRWFPRDLLAEVNDGHLNLAEAVLDVNGGGPLSTEALLAQVDLSDNAHAHLKEFSLNHALRNDRRFDEVGPTGQVLWTLRRLEPPDVLFAPRRLEFEALPVDRARLTPDLLALERELDDELSPAESSNPAAEDASVTVTFPHWRVGTLPLTPRLRGLFPDAYESPRIRFELVDGLSGETLPAWVVQPGQYVYGLGDLYQKYGVPVGGAVRVSRGPVAGQTVVTVRRRRPTREWLRTATVTPDGRISFSMSKQPVAVDYDELMVVTVDAPDNLDRVWLTLEQRRVPLAAVVADVFRELAKLNPQSTVHAKTLYSAVNVVRRVPPAPVFAELVTRPYFVHVGDLYWRFDPARWGEARPS